jgi:hypothetical protein
VIATSQSDIFPYEDVLGEESAPVPVGQIHRSGLDTASGRQSSGHFAGRGRGAPEEERLRPDRRAGDAAGGGHPGEGSNSIGVTPTGEGANHYRGPARASPCRRSRPRTATRVGARGAAPPAGSARARHAPAQSPRRQSRREGGGLGGQRRVCRSAFLRVGGGWVGGGPHGAGKDVRRSRGGPRPRPGNDSEVTPPGRPLSAERAAELSGAAEETPSETTAAEPRPSPAAITRAASAGAYGSARVSEVTTASATRAGSRAGASPRHPHPEHHGPVRAGRDPPCAEGKEELPPSKPARPSSRLGATSKTSPE